jgi:hypothetical protein
VGLTCQEGQGTYLLHLGKLTLTKHLLLCQSGPQLEGLEHLSVPEPSCGSDWALSRSLLYSLVTVQTWSHRFPSLCLSFLLHTMGVRDAVGRAGSRRSTVTNVSIVGTVGLGV